jgi:kynurenine formamidase
MLSDHAGTHVDSISHLTTKTNAMSIDKMPIEKYFFISAICLDVSFIGTNIHVTKQDIERALKESNLEIKKGEGVIFHTGHFKRNYGTKEYLLNYAGLNNIAMEYLAEKGVVSIGIDTPSVDTPTDKSNPVHTICGIKDISNLENLGDLSNVLGKRFTLIAVPLKIRDGTGSPVRAIALLDE